MEYYISDYILAEFHNPGLAATGKNRERKKDLVMPRQSIEQLFVKQRRADPGSLFPKVIVLPRITSEDNFSMEGPSDKSKIVDGKRATTTVFKPMVPPVMSQPATKTNVTSERPPKDPSQVRKRNVTIQENHYTASSLRTRSDSERNSFSQQQQQHQQIPRLVKRRSGSNLSKAASSDDVSTFEDVARRELWRNNKYPDHPLTRRESICSSCGGAMSFTNSVSTRRFSTVSIEVPNENLMKNRFINELASAMNKGKTSLADRPVLLGKPGEQQLASGYKSRTEQNAEWKNFRRLEKEKKLLYDLMSVLYKKNFIKEEIRPYVRHALDICGGDCSKSD